jgi:hypothetical protein
MSGNAKKIKHFMVADHSGKTPEKKPADWRANC